MLTRSKLEDFCFRVKRKFDSNILYNSHYDKADLLDDLIEFLESEGIQIKREEKEDVKAR